MEKGVACLHALSSMPDLEWGKIPKLLSEIMPYHYPVIFN